MAEINIIKLALLQNYIVVNGEDKRNVKGINSTPVSTTGTVFIKIEINSAGFLTKFELVKHPFRIPGTGIVYRTQNIRLK